MTKRLAIYEVLKTRRKAAIRRASMYNSLAHSPTSSIYVCPSRVSPRPPPPRPEHPLSPPRSPRIAVQSERQLRSRAWGSVVRELSSRDERNSTYLHQHPPHHGERVGHVTMHQDGGPVNLRRRDTSTHREVFRGQIYTKSLPLSSCLLRV